RAGPELPAHRLAGGRANLRAAGHRQIFHQRGAQPRLWPRAGDDHFVHVHHPGGEPSGRHSLCLARSQGEVPLMAGITGKDAVLTEYARQLETLDAPKGRSLTQDAMRRLTRNKAAVVSIGVVIFIVLFAFVGPYFLPWTYDKIDWSGIRKPPNFEAGHYAGTDQNGRDMLARIMQGTQMSLIVAGVATLVSVVIGVIWGGVGG